MGRSFTPKYRVECTVKNGAPFQCAWRGRVTAAKLEAWVAGIQSQLDEISAGVWPHEVITQARIVNQGSREVVQVWNLPMFRVI